MTLGNRWLNSEPDGIIEDTWIRITSPTEFNPQNVDDEYFNLKFPEEIVNNERDASESNNSYNTRYRRSLPPGPPRHHSNYSYLEDNEPSRSMENEPSRSMANVPSRSMANVPELSNDNIGDERIINLTSDEINERDSKIKRPDMVEESVRDFNYLKQYIERNLNINSLNQDIEWTDQIRENFTETIIGNVEFIDYNNTEMGIDVGQLNRLITLH